MAFMSPFFSAIDALWGMLFFWIRQGAPYFKSSLYFDLWRASKAPTAE
jgi:hypothetical protein